jgi:CRP/FNR family cyclic AMP-dependent transcriptional regulator
MSGLGEYWEKKGANRSELPERRTFSRGATIFKQGEQADCAYILESGAVQIFKMINGKRVTLGFVQKWGLFGEMALIDSSPRMATAYVTEDATVTVLARESFSRLLDGAPDGMLLVIESLTRTLRASGDNLAEARYRIMELEQG